MIAARLRSRTTRNLRENRENCAGRRPRIIKSAGEPKTLSFISDLIDSPAVDVIWVDEFLHRAALAYLQVRPDKSYSLCDAVSFLLMKTWGISDALTTDHHFQQAGFVRLLRA